MIDSALYRSLPLTYRQQEVTFLYDCLRGGDSCCVLGVSGSGKSNFARFIVRPDVRTAFLGSDAGRFAVVLIDGHSLDSDGSVEWRVYELMLHRLLRTSQAMQIDGAVLGPLEDLYQRLIMTPSALLGQRYLERVLMALIEGQGLSVAFIFDEFDDVVREANRQLFGSLRALRDLYKYSLTYALLVRDPLELLRDVPDEIEAFTELVRLHTTALGGYTRDDAAEELDRLADRWGYTPPGAGTIDGLWRLSGGHPGLLRAAYDALAGGRVPPDGLTSAGLASDPEVEAECHKLWASLPNDERAALATVAAMEASADYAPSDGLRRLMQKRVVALADDLAVVASPVLAVFAARQPLSREGLVVEPFSQRVFVDGREVELSPLEFKLLTYLYGRRSQVCSRDELIDCLYSDEKVRAGVSDNRIDVVVARLRDAIEPDRRQPRYVLTVRGRGFRLADSA